LLTRVFDAPRELVFEAFTRPEHVVNWWGPNGFTITIHEMDVRPGGVWRLTMHGPNAMNFENRIVFLEVVPPERLVYEHRGEGEGDPGFRTTVTFSEDGPRTRIRFQMLFPTAATRDYVAKEFGAVEGGKQTLDRLAAYLVDFPTSRSTSN
jgi:uncharacterized protein YndB with AHSA1/START domain